MWWIYSAVLVLGLSTLSESYSKYGRTCADIGCTSNEKCVMKSDPCSFGRRDDCGEYPTCERVSSNAHRTCSDYVCPPSMVCKMAHTGPRCVTDPNAVGKVQSYDTKNLNNIGGGGVSGGSNAPSAPLPPGNYPGGTPPRPGGQYNGGGYAGGAIGSGYPGGAVGSGYPGQQWGAGSTGHGSYPNNGYNNHGQYPAGYPNNNNQYHGQNPNQGYNPYGTGYNGNQNGYYNNQNGYGRTGNGYGSYGSYGYGYNGAASSDAFTDQLKTIGTEILKSTLTRLIMGDTRNANNPNNPSTNYHNGYRNYYN